MGHKVAPTITKERRRDTQVHQETDHASTEEYDDDREDVYMKTPQRRRKSELVPPPGYPKITQFFHGQLTSSQTTIPAPLTPHQLTPTQQQSTQDSMQNPPTPRHNTSTPTQAVPSPHSIATIPYTDSTAAAAVADTTAERETEVQSPSGPWYPKDATASNPATPPTPTRLGLTGDQNEQQTW